ncbi:MAG TPA: M48 family metalloprotease [Pyrinomonadaceae bacterium]|nr:M48 family metalloprotease [Pyrinomonadaceae bacterium]
MKNPGLVSRFAGLLLCSLVAYSITAQQPCARPPALPTANEPNIFSDEQEVMLGDAVAEYLQRNYHIIEDSDVTAFLTRVGERLIRKLPPNQLRFQFFLVDLADANAFVLPGGRIYVSRKLVAASESEDELAAVIAHELGHLVVHQGAIDTTRMFKEALGVTRVGDRRDIFEKYNQLIENLAKKPGAFKTGDREKGQLVADQAGLYALVAAGYDASAMARFWNRITETKGKTGNWFSDLFGTTRPEERRLREMLNVAEAIPASCRQPKTATQSDEFKEWQTRVVSYNGLGRRESIHGVVSKQQLSPPLRSDIIHLRFSPNGNYILAQDDAGINVLTRDPFKLLFRIETPFDAYYANFSPDSQMVVFYSDNLRVERWSVAEQKSIDVTEVVIHRGCLQTKVSPDGKLLACLTPDFELRLYNITSGDIVWRKKDFYSIDYSRYLMIIAALQVAKANAGDLNLRLINMQFSLDGRFFAAGCFSTWMYRRTNSGTVAEVVDTNNFAKVPIPDFVKKLIAGGFTFMDGNRLAGINRENVKKSAVVKFPTGELISELELWRPGLAATTSGDYLLIRPIKDYALGVMDINTGKITKVNERGALDIFDQFLVAELRNGEIGLYKLDKNELVRRAVLSNFTLGRLHVAELSADGKWLALSGRSRGGVWNLTNGQAVLSLRGFQGGFVSEDGYFFADFPKYEEADRNVVRFNLTNGEITPGAKVEEREAQQIGPYLLITKSVNAGAKEQADFESAENAGAASYVDYRKNVVIEVQDARTRQSLWTKTYPKESPRIWVAPGMDTVGLLWNVGDEAAKLEIKNDARLSQQLSKMQEKEGDYFLQILDARTGTELGRLLIETGKGSFRLSNVFAAGDRVIVRDTQNRILVYSLKSGEQVGKVFGGNATLSLKNNLMCVENEVGKLAIYDLNTLEKIDELIFSSPISLVRFTPDGSRLFVLTVNQFTYMIQISANKIVAKN